MRRPRRLGPEPAHRDARDHQLEGSPRRRCERPEVELGQGPFGLVDAADQEEASDLEIPGVRGVDLVAVGGQRRR